MVVRLIFGEGILVPYIDIIGNIDISGVAWILVIEKEVWNALHYRQNIQSILLIRTQATFRSLAASEFYQNTRVGNGIIITVGLADPISQFAAKLLNRARAILTSLLGRFFVIFQSPWK